MLHGSRHDGGKTTVLREIVLFVGGALGAGVFSAFAWTRVIPALRATHSGVATQAKIIRIETRVDRRGTARPRPVAAFTTPDRQRIVCSDVVSPSYVVVVGDEVPLRYLPANPQKSATMATFREAARGAALVLALAGLFAVAGIAGLLMLLGVI